jgi:hypothetical protein
MTVGNENVNVHPHKAVNIEMIHNFMSYVCPWCFTLKHFHFQLSCPIHLGKLFYHEIQKILQKVSVVGIFLHNLGVLYYRNTERNGDLLLKSLRLVNVERSQSNISRRFHYSILVCLFSRVFEPEIHTRSMGRN